MTDVFDAMKAHVDAITELLAANEIQDKAQSDLEKARHWLTTCEKEEMASRRKEVEAVRLLRIAVDAARKPTPKTDLQTRDHKGKAW